MTNNAVNWQLININFLILDISVLSGVLIFFPQQIEGICAFSYSSNK
ncbi:hypothetical protein VAS14_13139 [Photobacterium angustum S14]|uniref:Uncharacterized protein n=1 Tax=Photobacterium angustum (strain S14 / CCUG 15956) TaxID=314292 RepID=Q1ZUZ7_PHOAS|nr:hypothetical protein VAS14_13139 [Photobacterium angustum S14]